MSNVAEVTQQLQRLQSDKTVLCQVVDREGKAWNMLFEFCDVPHTSFVQLKVFHPGLAQLPQVSFDSVAQRAPCRKATL